MTTPPPSPIQTLILWFALTALAVTAIAGCVGLLVWALGRMLHLLAPVLWPLAFAAVLSYLLDPVVDWLERRRRMKRPGAIILVFTVATLLVLGLGATFVPRLVFETRELATKIPDYAARIQERTSGWMQKAGPAWLHFGAQTTAPETAAATNLVLTAPGTPGMAATNGPAAVSASHDLVQQIAESAVAWLPKMLPKIGSWLADQASRVAAWFGLIAGLALVPVYCFYFLLEKAGIQRRWTDYLPMQGSRVKEEIVFVLTAINDRLIVFFRGQLLVAACDGALYGIGFFAVGLNYALLLGFVAGLLSIIPYLGAALTLIPALVLAAVQFQDWLHPVLVLAVFATVQALEGLYISPKIIGDRVGLHPLSIIVAVMVGTTLLGGVLGGVLAIPLTAALRVLMFRYVWKKE